MISLLIGLVTGLIFGLLAFYLVKLYRRVKHLKRIVEFQDKVILDKTGQMDILVGHCFMADVTTMAPMKNLPGQPAATQNVLMTLEIDGELKLFFNQYNLN